jgi:Ca2+-binding EF-hand superfamily protein
MFCSKFPPQDFIAAMDAVTCKTVSEKMRWAFMMFDPDRNGYITRDDLSPLLDMMDQVKGLTDADDMNNDKRSK